MTSTQRAKRAKRKLADALMPWVAGNATVWPSTHAVHGHLIAQIRDLEARRAAAVYAVNRLDDALRAVDGGEYVGSPLEQDEVRPILGGDDDA